MGCIVRKLLIFGTCIIFALQFPCTTQNIFTNLLNQAVSYFISSDPNDVRFFLYSNPKNLEEADELLYGNKYSKPYSKLNPENPYTFLIHGFTQNHTSTFPQNVKNAYLTSGYGEFMNIIAIDWSKLTPKPSEPALAWPAFIKSIENVQIVGKRIEKFILYLIHHGYIQNGGSPSGDRIHLIGFSLGAHAAGITGKLFGDDTQSLIYRITGLDPAGPGFQNAENTTRLDKSFAQFVDVYHTNANEFGYNGDLGDVDFYINGGGPFQPFCEVLASNKSAIKEFVTVSGCSHNSAPMYYAESIYNTSIRACPRKMNATTPVCLKSEQIIFGENCPYTARGEYYLKLDV